MSHYISVFLGCECRSKVVVSPNMTRLRSFSFFLRFAVFGCALFRHSKKLNSVWSKKINRKMKKIKAKLKRTLCIEKPLPVELNLFCTFTLCIFLDSKIISFLNTGRTLVSQESFKTFTDHHL